MPMLTGKGLPKLRIVPVMSQVLASIPGWLSSNRPKPGDEYMRPVCYFAVALALAVGHGCSNVQVKRVPNDVVAAEKVKGFRYYLSRPYVVLANRVELGSTLEDGRPVALQRVGTANRIPGFTTVAADPVLQSRRVFSADGQELNVKEWTEAKVRPAASSVQQARYEQLPSGFVQPAPAYFVSAPLATGVAAPAPAPGPAAPAVVPNIQVVFLPDFDEMYAIQPINVAAKTQYEIHFTDGWQLDSAGATLDSTDIPIAFLRSIQNLFKLASGQQGTSTTGGGAKSPGPADMAPAAEAYGGPLVKIKHTYFLEPGMYRVQKSWERTPGECQSVAGAVSLLTSLGLDIQEEVSIAPENVLTAR
jgi:hypothetical protein